MKLPPDFKIPVAYERGTPVGGGGCSYERGNPLHMGPLPPLETVCVLRLCPSNTHTGDVQEHLAHKKMPPP